MANVEQLFEDLSGLTIMEVIQLKNMLEDKWGVKAASGGGGMMMMPGMMMGGAAAAAPAAEAAPVEEQTEFNVVISDVGPKKINVIKAVRQITNLGLKEAKDLVETANAVVLEAVSKDKAAEAKKLLEEEGAVVAVK